MTETSGLHGVRVLKKVSKLSISIRATTQLLLVNFVLAMRISQITFVYSICLPPRQLAGEIFNTLCL